LLTIFIAKSENFLNQLTDHSIDLAAACFQEGLATRKVHPSDFDPRRAQITCHNILSLTQKGSTAMTTVCNFPKFWINLGGLLQSSNLTTVESTMTRVFCMQGALKFHLWLLDIVPAAITRVSNPDYKPRIWIDQLTRDIEFTILGGNEVATFNSSGYLPNLTYHRQYTMALPKRIQYDNTKLLTSLLTSTLRCWLHFPPEEETLVALQLLDILLSKSVISILFLEKVWQMYKTPFQTVFNNDWSLRRSKSKLSTALKNFEEEFALHPFANSSSSSYKKLQDLSQLIDSWLKYTGASLDASEMVS
jgi:hypothetical protein